MAPCSSPTTGATRSTASFIGAARQLAQALGDGGVLRGARRVAARALHSREVREGHVVIGLERERAVERLLGLLPSSLLHQRVAEVVPRARMARIGHDLAREGTS